MSLQSWHPWHTDLHPARLQDLGHGVLHQVVLTHSLTASGFCKSLLTALQLLPRITIYRSNLQGPEFDNVFSEVGLLLRTLHLPRFLMRLMKKEGVSNSWSTYCSPAGRFLTPFILSRVSKHTVWSCPLSMGFKLPICVFSATAWRAPR